MSAYTDVIMADRELAAKLRRMTDSALVDVLHVLEHVAQNRRPNATAQWRAQRLLDILKVVTTQE